MENEIRCSIKIEDRAEGVRLVGVLMPYGTKARDRREVFETGSLSWDAKGIVVNRMHGKVSSHHAGGPHREAREADD